MVRAGDIADCKFKPELVMSKRKDGKRQEGGRPTPEDLIFPDFALWQLVFQFIMRFWVDPYGRGHRRCWT
jgi:hypothetical protein